LATALEYVLRQDPDVILVGELRDLETISIALAVAAGKGRVVVVEVMMATPAIRNLIWAAAGSSSRTSRSSRASSRR
jgi:Tfp pilus assembly pilus retraction ATPase PilT